MCVCGWGVCVCVCVWGGGGWVGREGGREVGRYMYIHTYIDLLSSEFVCNKM